MYDMKPKPKVGSLSGTLSPPALRPSPLFGPVRGSSIGDSVEYVTRLVLSGNARQLRQAAEAIAWSPQDRRDTLLGVLSWNKPVMDRLLPELQKHSVHSPVLDLCLAGGLHLDPLTYDSRSSALANAAQYVQMPLGQKLHQAIDFAPLGPAFKQQLLSRLSMESLAASAAVFMAMQLVPAGWALDAAVVLIATSVYGPAAYSIGEHLGAFFRLASSAGSEADLKAAGNHFAQAVATLGVGALATLVGRAASPKLARGIAPAIPRWKTQFTAARAQGLSEAQAGATASARLQAPVKAPVQPSKTLPGVYAGSAAANAELLALTEDLSTRFRVPMQARNGLKGLPRAQEKVGGYMSGGKTASSLLDVAASRLVFNTLDEVYAALTYIRGKYAVVQIKDRFVTPQPSGYRDLLLNLRMRNGYVVELRLELKAINDYAAQEHLIYEQRRAIIATAAAQKRGLTVTEQAEFDRLELEPQQHYAKLWNTITGGQK